jgi:hypothetical protein
MYVMDAPEPAQAINVIRCNSAGIGISRNGIGGPYTEAITGEGVLASAIVAGTIGASVVFAGELYGAHGTFTHFVAGIADAQRMEMGEEEGEPYFRVYDNDGNLRQTITKFGIDYANGTRLTMFSVGSRVGLGVFVGGG